MTETDHPDGIPSRSWLPTAPDPGTIKSLLLARGIETWAPIGSATLSAALDSGSAAPRQDRVFLQAGRGTPEMAGVSKARGAIAVAFPYDPRPAGKPVSVIRPGGAAPYLRIGAFAASHYYAALARILKSLARELATLTGHPYPDFRVAVNSSLPEKHLAELSGLGFRGRSDLLLSAAYGPACVLGFLLLPFDPLAVGSSGYTIGGHQDAAWESSCGSCHACADSCPGHAIKSVSDSVPDSVPDSNKDGFSRTYHREACIQHWMSTMEEPPFDLRPAFAERLYGCDDCILACPRSAGSWLPDRVDGSSPASRAAALLLPGEQRPGPYLSASFLAYAGDEELKFFFRKTALGLSWLGPGLLRRNAALAVPVSGTPRSTGI